MKLRMCTIEEPISLTDPLALRIWQKALWAKCEGYKGVYKSGKLPICGDDFFATHVMVGEELGNGEFEPIMMYKIMRLSVAEKYKVNFGLKDLLKNTPHEQSLEVERILKEDGDISYDSGLSFNPKYPKDKEFSRLMREYLTTYFCLHREYNGYNRWISCGVTRFKIDQYLLWLGAEEILSEFPLELIDGDSVRCIYQPNAENMSSESREVAEKHRLEFENQMIFSNKFKRRSGNRAA